MGFVGSIGACSVVAKGSRICGTTSGACEAYCRRLSVVDAAARLPSSTSSSSLSSSPSRATVRMTASASASTSAKPVVFEQPKRVVHDVLPRLYLYAHCPFCVRVQTALGIKNIKHELIFLANDDIATPTALVGKKVVPILEIGRPGQKEHEVMKESLDIIKRIDEDPAFGPTNVIKPATERTDIDAWIKESKELNRRLISPRYVRVPLPEFFFAEARDAYIRNHAIPEPGDYDTNFGMTPELLPKMNALMAKLDDLVFCEQHCSEGGISMDDVVLFSRLRSLELLKGAEWPPKVKAYMDYFHKLTDVPSFAAMAL